MHCKPRCCSSCVCRQEAVGPSSEPFRGSSEAGNSGAAASSVTSQPGSNGAAPSSANPQPHGNSTAPHSSWSTRQPKPRRARTPEERARDLVGHISLAKEEILKSDFWRYGPPPATQSGAQAWILRYRSCVLPTVPQDSGIGCAVQSGMPAIGALYLSTVSCVSQLSCQVRGT